MDSGPPDLFWPTSFDLFYPGASLKPVKFPIDIGPPVWAPVMAAPFDWLLLRACLSLSTPLTLIYYLCWSRLIFSCILIGGGVTPLFFYLFGDLELDLDLIGEAPLFFGDFYWTFLEFFRLFPIPEDKFLPLEFDLNPLAPDRTFCWTLFGTTSLDVNLISLCLSRVWS